MDTEVYGFHIHSETISDPKDFEFSAKMLVFFNSFQPNTTYYNSITIERKEEVFTVTYENTLILYAEFDSFSEVWNIFIFELPENIIENMALVMTMRALAQTSDETQAIYDDMTS